ncbi:MAG TPA: tetratricopeptide repeat protein [Pirellulales bacterium]|nr:tetratricopeptide repeat protein [Pirellulales bacterium]
MSFHPAIGGAFHLRALAYRLPSTIYHVAAILIATAAANLAMAEEADEHEALIRYCTRAIERDPGDAWAYYARGQAHAKKKQYDQAIRDFNEAIRLNPNDTDARFYRGNTWYLKGDVRKALGEYDDLLGVDSKHVGAYNARAWNWATSPDAGFRDGRKAVESAIRACELTNWKLPGYIDTLAAAYAEAGDFESAVKWQEQARDMVAKHARESFSERLELYRSRTPYRDVQRDR